ncbi:MAG: serpin family protein [Clostridiaceae bacterium]|jgi:serine protease inhibitor|nr:serpin family protein [Clostridiaceae bacterium]
MKKTVMSEKNAKLKTSNRGVRLLAFLLCMLMLFSVTACAPKDDKPIIPSESVSPDIDKEQPDETDKKTPDIDQDDALKKILLASPDTKLDTVRYDDISESFRAALWDFADKTSHLALGNDADKNALYSPISLYYPLAMLEAGAAGTTREGLRELLGLSDQNVGAELRKLYALMMKENKDNIEQIANSAWLSNEFREDLSQTWLDQLSHDFYASAFAVDFKVPATSEQMNAWVKKATRDKIDPKFEPDYFSPDIMFALINTLYYKSSWQDTYFEEQFSKEDIFHTLTGDVNTTFMNGGSSDAKHLEGDCWHAVQLNMVNGSIRFVLPDSGVTPEMLLEDETFLQDLLNGTWSPCELAISVPKFTYRSSIDLLDLLEPIGIRTLLQGTTDFSGMLNDNSSVPGIAVSKIDQKSFIALEEGGVEAAAMTIIEAVPTSAPMPDDIVRIRLDRPFMYVIADDAGAPLFVGIVRNPNVS